MQKSTKVTVYPLQRMTKPQKRKNHHRKLKDLGG